MTIPPARAAPRTIGTVHLRELRTVTAAAAIAAGSAHFTDYSPGDLTGAVSGS